MENMRFMQLNLVLKHIFSITNHAATHLKSQNFLGRLRRPKTNHPQLRPFPELKNGFACPLTPDWHE